MSRIFMLDSGAFSAWNGGGEVSLPHYVEYALKYLDTFDIIVNLDKIPGFPGAKITPELVEDSATTGWDNWIEMVDAGIPPERLMHIFHQGEDFKWLRRMVKNKKMPYIGLSPANDRTAAQRDKWLRRCMDFVLDKNGKRLVDFHGFGVTSFRLLSRYPWTSVDSTSWLAPERFGQVLVPQLKGYRWDHRSHLKISVSARTKKKDPFHINFMPAMARRNVLRWLDHLEIPLGESEFYDVKEGHKREKDELWVVKGQTVERILVSGVCNDYKLRSKANALTFLQQMREAGDFAVFISGGGMIYDNLLEECEYRLLSYFNIKNDHKRCLNAKEQKRRWIDSNS